MTQLPYPVIRLKKGKERSLLQRHPWVFSGAIAQEPDSLHDGDIVQVSDNQGGFLAIGHFHKGTITVRCFSFEEIPAEKEFFRDKIRKSLQLRKSLGLPSQQTNCFRLIHGEGDGMPGLVADIYANTLVLQCYTQGMYNLRNTLAEIAIEEIPFIESVYDKSRETMSKQGGTSTEDSYLQKRTGCEPFLIVKENGLSFHIDFVMGQKTGFFLDQRDNRQLLRQVSKGRSVLNTFCYTGGFSVAALEGDATMVHSVDSSARAMEATEKNVLLQGKAERHTASTEDVMGFLKKSKETWDIVVLDPPAYAKHLNQVSNAMIGYRNLNTEGLRHVAKGGLLFTFSCSQAVDAELFRKIIFQSALQAGREVKILHRLSQPADHPVSIYHPEAEYLKGLLLFVE